MNEKNLIPFNQRTESEQREIRSKGGKESARRRRDKRTFQETFDALLAMLDKDKNGNAVISPITGKPMSIRETIVMRALLEAKKGNVKALQTILDVMGERKIKIDNNITGELTADIQIRHIETGHTPASSEAEVRRREKMGEQP